MSGLKNNVIIKVRKLYNIFSFIVDLNSVNDGGVIESNY